MNYTAIIVDDELDAREMLAELLKEFPEIDVVSKSASVNEAIDAIMACQPDLIFLDIDMPDKDGFALANYIRKHKIDTAIIFVTAFNQYAIDAFKVAAFDYLLKPIDPSELHKTIERFKSDYSRQHLSEKLDRLALVLSPEKIRFNTRTGFILIDPKKIVYCEADGNYCKLYLDSGKTESITRQLGYLEEQLNHNVFIRISRSVIINKNFISSFDRTTRKVKLINILEEIEFKVSREGMKKFNLE